MNVRTFAFIALIAFHAGCGSDAKHSDDPGEPDIMYGTKAGGDLFIAGEKVGYVFFMFLAPDEPDRARFFARPDDLASVGVKSYYLSLVLDDARWAAGEFHQALAGRAEFVLEDGKRYAAEASELGLDAKVVVGDTNQGAHFPSGTLDLTVPADEAGAKPLSLKLTINNGVL